MHDTLNAAPIKIGEKTIDAEHDLQMQLLDSLSQSLAAGGDFAPTRHILEQFIEFSDMHFLSEQLIMRLNGYPGYEAHLEEHTRLMKKVREIREAIVHGEKVSSTEVKDGIRTGRVQFGGITRQACLDFVPEAKEGDYVMVHVGFAISVVDKDEAERTYALLEAMGLLAGELAPDGAAPADS